MSFSPTDSRIFGPLFRDDEVATIFTDEHFVRLMVEVEIALARVQGRLGVIPPQAAEQIEAKLTTFTADFAQIEAGIEKAGVPIIALVKQLEQHIGGDAAAYIHWGATTQDIMDTAVILQSSAALDLMETSLYTLIENLAQMVEQHQDTLLAGRTHSQHALPITFGLKVAGWLAPLLRHMQRLSELKPRLLVVQLGGAAGTLASLGNNGTAVQQVLAQELKLGVPLMPWHTQRDNLIELAGWLSLVNGSLAKMAQDIILMAQSEVAELRETADSGRGGSSTLPQKSNPIISEGIIAAARTNASHLSAMQQAAIQEHERATHGWQMEWLNLPQMFALTAVSLKKAVFLSQNLVVDRQRMQENISRSNGLMLAEAATFALSAHMDRLEAKSLVGKGCQTALAQNKHLVDVLQEMTSVSLDWHALRDEANYLGATTTFIDQILQAVKEMQKPVS